MVAIKKEGLYKRAFYLMRWLKLLKKSPRMGSFFEGENIFAKAKVAPPELKAHL